MFCSQRDWQTFQGYSSLRFYLLSLLQVIRDCVGSSIRAYEGLKLQVKLKIHLTHHHLDRSMQLMWKNFSCVACQWRSHSHSQQHLWKQMVCSSSRFWNRRTFFRMLTIYRAVWGWSPFTLIIYYYNVFIALYETSCCSSGHKTAAVTKLVGELPWLHVPVTARKISLWGGSKPAAAPLERCLPKGV